VDFAGEPTPWRPVRWTVRCSGAAADNRVARHAVAAPGLCPIRSAH